MNKNTLYGLILCGGNSSRLGFPKFKLKREGVAVYQWWTNKLSEICKRTYVSCKAFHQTEIEFPDVVLDEAGDAGPLEGIYQAFQLNNKVSWLVVACDLVNADVDDVNTLIENNDDEKDAVCYINPETREPYSLFTIYNPLIESALITEYHSELKSAKRLLTQSNVIKLTPTDPNILHGINTKEDLDKWQRAH
jgi:molybdopterin-guanine dinucleotide biosynthesis protein A